MGQTNSNGSGFLHFIAISGQKSSKSLCETTAIDCTSLDENFLELAVCLVFLIVSGKKEITNYLPQDSAFSIHLGLVQAALNAYQNQQTEAVDEALKELPFRSAFCDLRALLKAQLASSVSVEQTQTLLSKIPEHSPCRSVANALLAYSQTGVEFVETIGNLIIINVALLLALRAYQNCR